MPKPSGTFNWIYIAKRLPTTAAISLPTRSLPPSKAAAYAISPTSSAAAFKATKLAVASPAKIKLFPQSIQYESRINVRLP